MLSQKKSTAPYFVPALLVFVTFIIMHNYLLSLPFTREEIETLIASNNEESSEIKQDKDENIDKTGGEDLPQGSDIPFIGPQHYYHSFTGALATDLKNNSGILTIEIAVSIFMGKLSAEAYFEALKV